MTLTPPLTPDVCIVGAGFGVLIDRGQTPDLGVIFQPLILLPLLGLAVLSLLPVVYTRLKDRKLR